MIFGEGLDGDIEQPKLALGSVAHRVDYDDPRGSCSDNGFRGDEDTSPIGNAIPQWNLIVILIFATALIGLILAMLHGIECGIWAAAYLWLGAVDSPTDALLYSVDSMATLGASGLMLRRPWQLMGGLEAVNGMILFGVSTAYVFAVMQLYWSMLAKYVTPAADQSRADRRP